jgi:phage tail-like protein
VPEVKQRLRPLQSAFALELDGIKNSSWKTVSGIDISIEVVDDFSVGEKAVWNPARIPGQVTYGDLTLTRGYAEQDLDKWFKEIVVDGKPDLEKNGSITAFSSDLKTVIAQWNFIKAWPLSLTSSDLSTDSSSRMIETLTLVVQEIKREK